jgi:MoxR-like ATPase
MNKLQDLKTALNEEFLERDDLVNGVLVNLLCGRTLLMLGPPGTAKSALTRAICTVLSGKYFEWCLNKLTTPEEVFGPISLKALEQDRYLRLTTGKAPEADIIFVDEFFKQSSAVGNTWLGIMNEKIYYNDGKPGKIPLKAFYAASNEVPQGEELAANFDRFVLKYFVEPVREDRSVESLFLGGRKAKYPSIDMAELVQWQAEAANVSPDDVRPVLAALKAIRKAVENEGIQVSDRKWVQAVHVLKAQAVLNGHTVIEEEDLPILNHVLWAEVGQRAAIRKIINKVANPLGEKVSELVDSSREIFQSVKSEKIDAIEGFNKIKHAVAQLAKLGDPTKNTLLNRALVDLKAMQTSIAKEDLGIGD